MMLYHAMSDSKKQQQTDIEKHAAYEKQQEKSGAEIYLPRAGEKGALPSGDQPQK